MNTKYYIGKIKHENREKENREGLYRLIFTCQNFSAREVFHRVKIVEYIRPLYSSYQITWDYFDESSNSSQLTQTHCLRSFFWHSGNVV